MTISPSFVSQIGVLTAALKPALTEVMDAAMQEMERVAQSEADWHADGTIAHGTGDRDYPPYQVTGAARAGIIGYAEGAHRDPFRSGSFTDAVTSSKANQNHFLDPQLAPLPEADDFKVVGVLTMTDNTAAYLQHHERGDYPVKYGVSPPSPLKKDGKQITDRTLEEHEADLISMLQAGAELALKDL